jgi:hypothetical protein
MAPDANKEQADILAGRKPMVGPMTAMDSHRAVVMSAGLSRWMVGEPFS